MDTALLSNDLWDLVLGSNGDLAIASDPYSIAQDVACALKTFQGECYFDTTLGVPYFQQIFGQFPSIQFLKAQFVAAAMTVPQVTSAQCFLSSLVNRSLSGQVQFTYQAITTTGQSIAQTGIVSFRGDNRGLVTFVGSNGSFLQFAGS